MSHPPLKAVEETLKVKHSPYSQFDIRRMNYRDFLAMDRTTLANERTLLSYFRTSLMVLASAITLIKIFTAPEIVTLGYVLLPLSGVIMCIGIYRYWKIRKAIYIALDRLLEEAQTTCPDQPFMQHRAMMEQKPK